MPVTFYVANNEGSVLLSCKMTFAFCLIQPRSRLDYLPPLACLITTTMDHPKKTKLTSLKVHRSKKKYLFKGKNHKATQQHLASMNTVQKSDLNIMIASKEQILSSYPDIFEGIARFPGPPYHIQVDPNITPKQTHVDQCLFISKKPSRRNRQDASSRYHQSS